MSSLSAGFNVGSTSTSALIKSASSLSAQLAAYQDDVAKITYENSAKTASDLASYQSYLEGRVTNLTSTGTVADATKALNMQQDIVSATHENISSDIQRENIEMMAGNATLSDKYGVIVGEYQRALNIGDDALAQSLESQAYSVSQSIQLAAQTAADSAATLGKATLASNAEDQAEIVTNLKGSLSQLNGDIKTLGISDANSTINKWVSQNSATLEALGVKLPSGAQPNYWNVVNGVMGAMYNHDILASQAYSLTDPNTAQEHLNEAQGLLDGQTPIPTLAGNLTGQQIQEAESNPAMFVYDAASSSYKLSQQTGYQYDQNGDIEPTYSGSVKQTVFLNAIQTNSMTKLGLSFSAGKAPSATQKTAGETNTGDGVTVQASSNSPQWLKNILTQNGTTQMYVDPNSRIGGLQFEADSPDGSGKAYYDVVPDGTGKFGVYQNMPNGAKTLVGGDYGFNAAATDLLINQAQQTAHIDAVHTAAAQAALKAATPPSLPKLAPVVSAPRPTNATQPVARLQPAATTSVLQNANVNPQKTVSGSSLQNANGGLPTTVKGVPLKATSGQAIPL